MSLASFSLLAACAGGEPLSEKLRDVEPGPVAVVEASVDAPTTPEKECVYADFRTGPGFGAELAAAVDPAFIKPGAFFGMDLVLLPGLFQAHLEDPRTESGFHAIPVFSIVKEQAVGGSGLDLVAIVGGAVNTPTSLTFEHQQSRVATGLFKAMTRATETIETHEGQGGPFDPSKRLVTRQTANGRVRCYAQTTFEDVTLEKAWFACHMHGVDSMAQRSYLTSPDKCLNR